MAENKLSERRIEYLNIDNLPTIYSNNVEVGVSPWDFRMRFGQIEEADESHMIVKNVATVYMAVDHVRALVDVLQKNLAIWDELYGKKA